VSDIPLDLAKLARVKAALLAYFEEQPTGVSFVELERAAGADAGGDYLVANKACNDANVCWWAGASLEFSTAVVQLFAERLIDVHPCEKLIYLIDGRMPVMPIARRPSATRPYRELHWLPVAFSKHVAAR
jgi:hypothetical protein